MEYDIPIIVKAGSKTTFGKTKKGTTLVRVGFLFGNPIDKEINVIPTKKMGEDYVVIGRINKQEEKRNIWMIKDILITRTTQITKQELQRIENQIWKQKRGSIELEIPKRYERFGLKRRIIRTVDTPGTKIRDDGISKETGEDLVVTCDFLHKEVINEEIFREMNPCTTREIKMLANAENFSLDQGAEPRMIIRVDNENEPVFELGEVCSNHDFEDVRSIIEYRKKVQKFQTQLEEWCEREIGSSEWWFRRGGFTSPLRRVTDLWNITQIWRKTMGLPLLKGEKAFTLGKRWWIPTWMNALSCMKYYRYFKETDTEITTEIYHVNTDKENGRTMIWISHPINRCETLKGVMEPFEMQKQVNIRLRNQLQGNQRNIISINSYELELDH